MARKISSGAVGEPSVGGINVSPSAVISTAENRDITLGPLGTGSVVFTNNAVLYEQNDLRFADADSSNYVAFQAPSTVASNVTWTLPNADGSANQAIVTNGSGTLSFAAPAPPLTDNTTDSSTNYLAFTTSTSGSLAAARVSTTKLSFQPSTGILTTTELTVNGTARSLRTENVKTASHTLELADRDKVVAFNGTGSQTVTVPLNSTVAFPVGSVVYINRLNTGAVTLAGEGGVTLSKVGSFSQNEEIYIRKRDTNSWIVIDSPKTLSGTGGSVSSASGYTIHTYSSGSSTFVIG
jgi:hypothetical protein